MVRPPGGSPIADVLSLMPEGELRDAVEEAARAIGVAPGQTMITLPNGRAIVLAEWTHQIHEMYLPWGGRSDTVFGDGEELLLYTLSVAPLPAQQVGLDARMEGRSVPELLQETRDLGKVEVWIGNRPFFAPPIRYLVNRNIQLHVIEDYFKPRALFKAATVLCELLARAPTTIVDPQQLVALVAQLEAAHQYMHGVGEAYKELLKSVHGGELTLPLTVRERQRLTFQHVLPPKADDQLFEEIAVEYVCLQKRAVR